MTEAWTTRVTPELTRQYGCEETHLIDRQTSTSDQPPDNAQDDREQNQTKNYPRPGSNFEL
jgi:hypothetical protein